MSMHPVKLEDVETLPATTLLKLTFNELSSLIQEAERKADKLYLIADWLRGIKTEKAFRNGTDKLEGGEE